MEILRAYPLSFELLQMDLARKLNAIPEIPTYEDWEVAESAQKAFEKGYGAGMAEAHRQALAMDFVWATALTLCGNVACAIETTGARLLRVAITRLQGMPLFIPGSAGGAGFFWNRAPKPAPGAAAQGAPFMAPRNPTPAPATEAPAPAAPPAAPPQVAKAPPTAGNATTAAATQATPTGQMHHAISKRVYDALQERPLLKGHFKERDPQFTARAATAEDHKGYQKWHIDLDKEVVQFIEETENLDPKKFAAWLQKRYRQPDLKKRFPEGLGSEKR